MTRQVVEAGRPLRIAVHDHLVVGKDKVASFKALGLDVTPSTLSRGEAHRLFQRRIEGAGLIRRAAPSSEGGDAHRDQSAADREHQPVADPHATGGLVHPLAGGAAPALNSTALHQARGFGPGLGQAGAPQPDVEAAGRLGAGVSPARGDRLGASHGPDELTSRRRAQRTPD